MVHWGNALLFSAGHCLAPCALRLAPCAARNSSESLGTLRHPLVTAGKDTTDPNPTCLLSKSRSPPPLHSPRPPIPPAPLPCAARLQHLTLSVHPAVVLRPQPRQAPAQPAGGAVHPAGLARRHMAMAPEELLERK